MKIIKAILFDLDCTLLDRDASVKRFINEQYERLSDHVGHIPKGTYTSRFIALDNRGYVSKDTVYRQLVNDFDIALTPESFLEDYLANFHMHCVPFSNLVEMLNELKSLSLKLGMITNGKGQFQTDNIQALGISDYFDSILISEWEGMKKPDEALFERALERLEVQPDESMFVGDHPDKDIEAAKRIGMKTIWKKSQYFAAPATDFTIESLEEIPSIVLSQFNGQ